MLRKFKIPFFIFVVLVIPFQSCTVINAAQKRPEWVSQKPVDNTFYIGVGKSNKSTSNYLQAAKNNALADLISEISVNISSHSLLHQLEDNSGLKESYESYINLKTKDEIEGYELVDTYEDKNAYWVYYRLSKAEYARKKREKLERAKNLAKDYFEKARNAENIYDINNALVFYTKAFDAVKKHLDEDLSVFLIDEGRVYLDNAIFQSIQSIFSNIEIKAGKELFQINTLSADNDPVYASVKYKTSLETQNLENIPITFYFSELTIDAREKVRSKNRGIVECSIANMAPKGKRQIIKAELNIDDYFGEDAPDNFLKQMFLERGTIPYGNIMVEVNELFAYLESEETLFGEPSNRKPVTNVLKSALSENFFSFTEEKENANVLIKITSSVVEGEKMDQYNLHTAFLDCNIAIQDLKSGMDVYSRNITNVKGMKSGTFNHAAEDAIEKTKEKIINEIIPEIRKIEL
ncbi:MAG: LPP20 family lipoprotein [Bacteroidota bacterium]